MNSSVHQYVIEIAHLLLILRLYSGSWETSQRMWETAARLDALMIRVSRSSWLFAFEARTTGMEDPSCSVQWTPELALCGRFNEISGWVVFLCYLKFAGRFFILWSSAPVQPRPSQKAKRSSTFYRFRMLCRHWDALWILMFVLNVQWLFWGIRQARSQGLGCIQC